MPIEHMAFPIRVAHFALVGELGHVDVASEWQVFGCEYEFARERQAVESLYLGTPVAACKCIPVVSRLVDEGRTGYLAEQEDPESLAQAMLRALELGRIESRYQSASIEDFERVLLRR